MIGELRHRIQIWKAVKGRDNLTGERISTYILHKTVWGSYKFNKAGSDEKIIAGRDGAVRSVDITIRHRKDIYNDYYLKVADDRFEIQSILPDSNKTYLTIEALQVDTNLNSALADSEGNEWIIPDSSFIDINGNKWIREDEDSWLINPSNTENNQQNWNHGF